MLQYLKTFIFFTSDLDFDDGLENPPTEAQPADDGSKPNEVESEGTEGEDVEHQPTPMHSEPGGEPGASSVLTLL